MRLFLALLIVSPALKTETFKGACDGSAVVAAGDRHFLNATDEDNILRLYKLGQPAPVRQFDLGAFLQTEVGKNGPKEADIEGVARSGNRLYWIGSHGRDKKGKAESSRHRLFATDLSGTGAAIRLAPAGRPFTGLIEALIGDGSEVAAALRSAESKPHQAGGIEIEGLAAAADGSLLIGFRSPLVHGKALIVRIFNPGEVVRNSAAPRFGSPALLDLGGLGVRDLVSTGKPDRFLVLAGPSDLGGTFRLYEWETARGIPRLLRALSSRPDSPEAILVLNGAILIAGDGGEIGMPPCKDRPIEKRTFEMNPLP